jgi:hypothetical protein
MILFLIACSITGAMFALPVIRALRRVTGG